MIPEIRYIIFNKRKLREIIMAHIYASDLRIPQIRGDGLILELFPGKMIKVTYVNDQYGNTSIVEFMGEKLLNVITDYCIYTSIPLPIDSQKIVKIFDGGLCLVIAKGISVENIRQIHELIGY